ncbi:Short-chain dehydrogenase/reductase family protein, putative [Penicillium digitatum]|uniref:Short-chain dehydrogenase/reductase family protein, putative n=3 Tax=Penicillium digitatum TaxID=36651 RepID=K9G515_PEND2|nr:Short-chain dehydrogenase/reductase family protein, putative [Penicillium digitatum Pd1]EKV08353.1 Short-chain dehydrogenase/reductase family protein, putative [Penicillium digitatum Pd1]EKV09893.1 Short-chain dehydrogenase/reductase family protein, putative [Penicillium digitatum PHI26]QQK41659.1 Short-chain dehydrogenase/reductase family protein, putative [Penicillium digitatum]
MSSSTPQLIKTTAKVPHPTPGPTNPHTNVLTIDTLINILSKSLLNPFIAWISVLCLRAQVTPSTDPAWILTVSYATALTVLFIARIINQRAAHGVPRTVDFEHEVVVITGGASGLGQLIAQMYSMRGGSVAVLDIKNIPETCSDEVFGEGVLYIKCDVAERGALEVAKKRILKELGTPTIVINCAAARINGLPLLDLPADAFEMTIRTNLLAAFHLYQVFLPGIIAAENGGTLVTVSSVLGQLGAAGLSDYAASKAGLSALHRTIEAETRGNPLVKTLLVEVGQMSTPLFDWVRAPNQFFAPVLEPVEVAREMVTAIDSGRGGVIRLPIYAKLVNWYAVLPATVQRIARYLSGIDAAVIQSRQTSDKTD